MLCTLLVLDVLTSDIYSLLHALVSLHHCHGHHIHNERALLFSDRFCSDEYRNYASQLVNPGMKNAMSEKIFVQLIAFAHALNYM